MLVSPQQLRHVEEAEEARQELIALQIENARLHEASDARQADRLQFEVCCPQLLRVGFS
jgi:hypothetical protein